MREGIRWAGSLALVLAIHGAAIGLALAWSQPDAPNVPPPAAVMLELARCRRTPDHAGRAPGAQAERGGAEPQEPPPVDLKPMKIGRDSRAAAAGRGAAGRGGAAPPELPPPVDLKPPDKPKPVEKPKPAPPRPRSVAAAPEAAPAQAPQAVAPAPNVASAQPSAGLPNWKGALLRHLERHKRYPQEAQRARREGVVTVRFTMSRDGRVLAARIERASGVASLDQEGLDLLQRAQPLPPLPSDQPGESLELVVPIQFQLTR